MLPATSRLREGSDFAATVRGRPVSRQSSRLMVVHLAHGRDRAGQVARVGFVVSKSVGGAVVRNRTKRVLRAVFAERMAVLPEGTDVVVRANPALAGVAFAEVAAEVDRLLSRSLSRLARS